MKTKLLVSKITALLFISFLLAGCGSMRVSTTLEPEPEANKVTAPGKQKFSIVQFNNIQNRQATTRKLMFSGIDLAPVSSISDKELQQRAAGLYPEMFGEKFEALPVYVDVKADCSGHEAGEWLQNLTLGILPFPAGARTDYTIHIRVFDGNELIIDETESFSQKFRWWRTILTPLGVVPVFGFSDVRTTSFISSTKFQGDRFRSRLARLTMDSIVEAVAQGLRNADPEKIKTAAAYRKERIRQIAVHDQNFWSWLDISPAGQADVKKPEQSVAVLSLFSDYPTWPSRAVESVVVARMRAGQWEPVTGYLKRVQPLMSVTVSLKNDRPSQAVLKSIAEPPLDDFIGLPDVHNVDEVRWSNRVLVDAKNTSLPRLMKEGTPRELTDMITRIEKTVLDLEEKAEMAESRAQQPLVSGGDPETAGMLKNMAVLYRQRLGILEAFLATLKRTGAR